jgi:hypothetical protein
MTTFTLVHVVLSLVGILSGLVAMGELVGGRTRAGVAALFLATTVATSLTGFGFPFHRFLPSHAVGVISLVVLALALFARYGRRLAGAWRRVYAVTAVVALYLNSFVLVAQLFQKVPALKALAPTQSEPPFLIAQVVVLVLFVALGVGAVKKFRPAAAQPAAA